MNIPGFTAESALYRSTKSYKVKKNGIHGGKTIQLAIDTRPTKPIPFEPVDGGFPSFDPRCVCPNIGANWKLVSSDYESEINWCWCSYNNKKTGNATLRWVRPKE